MLIGRRAPDRMLPGSTYPRCIPRFIKARKQYSQYVAQRTVRQVTVTHLSPKLCFGWHDQNCAPSATQGQSAKVCTAQLKISSLCHPPHRQLGLALLGLCCTRDAKPPTVILSRAQAACGEVASKFQPSLDPGTRANLPGTGPYRDIHWGSGVRRLCQTRGASFHRFPTCRPFIGCLKVSASPASTALNPRIAMDEGTGLEVREKIQLTELEAKIFDALLATVRQFGLKTQLRVAGGWVRDKLLGRESHDIDIALDDCMGEEFASKVNEYLQANNLETHQVGVIRSNPEQSKHLETATMRVHGQWIDLVNLRSETYAENSRIPTMEFGSAKGDALRRDLTINSLFYNISTGEVEDFTGKGISDLREGIIRTPLPPVQTFLDDPLRVLRSVRFAARFQFRVVEDLAVAAQLPEVRAALASKVSRERIGKEVELMLGGRAPLRAMQLLADCQLFPTICALPEGATPPITADYGRRCVASLAEVVHVMDLRQMALPQPPPGAPPEVSTAETEDKICTLLAGLLLPLREVVVFDKKKRAVPVASSIIRESLKLKAAYADTVVALHAGAQEMHARVPELLTETAGSTGEAGTQGRTPGAAEGQRRVAAGLLVRKLKRLWQPALLLASVLDHPAASPIQGDADADVAPPEDATSTEGEGAGASGKRKRAVREADKRAEFQALVASLGLERAWELKPLLDGKAIIRTLNMKGGGPLVGKWADKAMEWQLANPQASVEDCQAWLQAEYKNSS